jgi:hypothetical protein
MLQLTCMSLGQEICLLKRFGGVKHGAIGQEDRKFGPAQAT